jgi:signal transduction histidine kinase
VEIKVADDGPGVPVEFQDRIFDPFFTTRERSRRSGLGLSIALRLVEQAAGTLTCCANRPSGSVFVIKLQTHREGAK